MNRVHLHRHDYPTALQVLAQVVGAGRRPRAELARAGYEPTESGVWVDWDALEHSILSSTQIAAVTVVRGIAAAERHGGWPTGIARALADAIEATS